MWTPNSLATNDELQSSEENVVNNLSVADATPTPRTTVTPAPAGDTLLYYNVNGGSFYHLDPYCPSVGEEYQAADRYLPLQRTERASGRAESVPEVWRAYQHVGLTPDRSPKKELFCGQNQCNASAGWMGISYTPRSYPADGSVPSGVEAARLMGEGPVACIQTLVTQVPRGDITYS